MKFIKRITVFGILLVLAGQLPSSCARRGNPEGGPKDTIPPAVISTKPPNYSIHFNQEVIRINFDEYVKLKDPDKQILISPPLKTKPIIKPMGQALKYIEITLTDTLKENTTYTLNFGRSIEDNNEGNVLEFYKYVFSTGDYIDSLSVEGRVKDAYNRETEEGVSVMLYKLDKDFADSIVYQRPPDYISYTQDSTHRFKIDNIAEGKYKIIALQDKNGDYLFNQKNEKIGFLEDTIEVPATQTYELELFQEIRNYSFKRITQVSQNHLLFGYEGKPDSLSIRMFESEDIAGFEAQYYPQIKHDSIDYWFKPDIERDSLKFEIAYRDWRDTLKIKYNKMDRDSLRIEAEPSSSLPLTGNFVLSANIPLAKLDTNFVQIRNKDSVPVPFKYHYNRKGNSYTLDFDKEEQEEYHIQLLPGAVTDFYGLRNDSLSYRLTTRSAQEFADVQLTIENIARYPVIVQLADEKGKTKRELIHGEEEGAVFSFPFVEPRKYYVRLIYDDNANGIWDTGNYLKKIQPEEVIYMPELLDVRQNWEISQTFILN